MTLSIDILYYALTKLCWAYQKEAWFLQSLSNLSAITTRIKLGPVITYLIPQYRNIALLAKQATTLQEMSKGRLEFRTGAGATPDYAVQWWYPYGIDYPNRADRVSLLDEGIKVLKLLWSKPNVNFSGKYFKINGASLRNPKQSIPITVAAKGKRMMEIADQTCRYMGIFLSFVWTLCIY